MDIRRRSSVALEGADMDRELIIRLAREAGLANSWDLNWSDPAIERFAALVAAHERERICKQIAMMHDSLSLTGTTNWGKT